MINIKMYHFLCFIFHIFSIYNFFVAGFNNGEDIKRSQFPDKFFFGTSTSSYQTEGAYQEDGKGLSNWDVFTHTRGNRANGDVANDHYHRYLEDVEILHSLGGNAYRLSISWSRILPRGRFGEVNPLGLKFYNNVIDNLVMRGIEPFVTLHHNDFPQELEDRYASWLSPLMQYVHFSYLAVSFGDRVKHWITINEPNIFVDLAYNVGSFPPEHCSQSFNCPIRNNNSNTEHLTAMHNMLLAHAKIAKLYHDHFQPKQGGLMGIVAHAFMFEPMTDNEADKEATRRAMAFDLGWVFDPLVFGDYPPEMRHYLGKKLPTFSEEQKSILLKESIDFIGINHYTTLYAKDCINSVCNTNGDGKVIGFSIVTGRRNGTFIGEPTANDGHYVVPRGMEEVVNYLKKRYDNKLMFVFENGYGTQLGENMEDILHDEKRIKFYKAYLASLSNAISDGANVGGYFIWSLMDNYEWLADYNVGMGLYYVDRKTLKRTPKLSAKWYRSFLTNTTLDDAKLENISYFQEKEVMILNGASNGGGKKII